MAPLVVETSVFSASCTVPDPGNLVTAASIEIAIQPLCNRTQALVDGKITVKSGVTFLGNVGCDWVNNGHTTLTGDSSMASCTSSRTISPTTTSVPRSAAQPHRRSSLRPRPRQLTAD